MIGLPSEQFAHDGFDFGAGSCRELALALHERFGYPLEVTLEHNFRDGRVVGLVHAYGVIGPVTIVEAAGIGHYNRVLGAYNALDTEGVFSRRFVTPAQLGRPWPDAPPLDPRAITAARAFIDRDPARFVPARDWREPGGASPPR